MLGHEFVICLLHICYVFVMVPNGFVVAFGYKFLGLCFQKAFKGPSEAFKGFLCLEHLGEALTSSVEAFYKKITRSSEHFFGAL